MNVVYNDVNRCSLDLGHLPENSVSPRQSLLRADKNAVWKEGHFQLFKVTLKKDEFQRVPTMNQVYIDVCSPTFALHIEENMWICMLSPSQFWLTEDQTNLMEIEVKQGSRVANDIATATLLLQSA